MQSKKRIMAAAVKSLAGESTEPNSPFVRSDEPLYLEVARALKKENVGGVYPVGSQLPTEDELCQRFSVSRYTVREALRRLREDHLVMSRQGAGTVVVPRGTANAYAQEVMSINDLLALASGSRFAIEAMKMVVIDEAISHKTGLKRGEEWLEVTGLGYRDDMDAPVCWAEYYIHRDFAAVGRMLPRHTGPIFPLIEDLFGQNIVEVKQDIGATLIAPELAEGLKVEAKSAALEIIRWYKTSEGQLAQLTISTLPANRYIHSMSMRRVKS
jgi:DNA-binding GntR family transcriptional regulator